MELSAPRGQVGGEGLLFDKRVHEAGRRDDFRSSSRHVGWRDDSADTAIVVPMAVRVDDAHHGLAWTVRKIQVESHPRGAWCREGVDNDHTRVALDDRHAGYGEAAHLIYAIDHLEQSIRDVELGLTP